MDEHPLTQPDEVAKEQSSLPSESVGEIWGVVAEKRPPMRLKFKFALQGISTALRTEVNLRIHVMCAVGALALCIPLRVELWGWISILILIGLVLFAELFNTAIETVVNISSPAYHPLAKRAKDIAAGAVLVLAAISVIAGLAIYLNALLRLIG